MDGETEVCTSFVTPKTRVAPLAKQTIPLLELLGALILARLMARIKNVFANVSPIERQICLTDSAVTLS